MDILNSLFKYIIYTKKQTYYIFKLMLEQNEINCLKMAVFGS